MAFALSFLAPLQSVAAKALSSILPPLCLSCDNMLMERQGFCSACWGRLNFIASPFCAACGLPFPFTGMEGDDKTLCGSCLEERPLFTEARSVFVYDQTSKDVILSFKHHDRTDAAPALATLLSQAGRAMIEACDVIMPVPLHRMRLFTRRYNQAALLAQALARASGKKVDLVSLTRPRATPSQGHLTRAQRYKNVEGAFVLSKTADIKGKNILLVDDVLTTGATANACAKALLKGKAKNVMILTLARVVKAD
jgi:ComF family protein